MGGVSRTVTGSWTSGWEVVDSGGTSIIITCVIPTLNPEKPWTTGSGPSSGQERKRASCWAARFRGE
jgi:hypothetical protein